VYEKSGKSAIDSFMIRLLAPDQILNRCSSEGLLLAACSLPLAQRSPCAHHKVDAVLVLVGRTALG
ncbi:hypothetical protein ACSFA3_23510, partial [Variovorax sp. RHLX14]|uniref:hypothetical protein n=1 Tax=Variovorax sp. RHLX14 TaxID=1259731 RepID=UPI003F446A5D